jgi:hypothetical protein
VIPIENYRAEFLCGGHWTDCTVLGATGDEHEPKFLISFEDDQGCETLLRVSRVRRLMGRGGRKVESRRF